MTTRNTFAVFLREHGGPEVLRIEATEIGEAGLGKIWLKQTKIGVNLGQNTEPARAPGCDYPVIYTEEDFCAHAEEITNG